MCGLTPCRPLQKSFRSEVPDQMNLYVQVLVLQLQCMLCRFPSILLVPSIFPSYFASCAACSAIASAFAAPKFLFSPCRPFYNGAVS